MRVVIANTASCVVVHSTLTTTMSLESQIGHMHIHTIGKSGMDAVFAETVLIRLEMIRVVRPTFKPSAGGMAMDRKSAVRMGVGCAIFPQHSSWKCL
jgi:hypothetical protein